MNEPLKEVFAAALAGVVVTMVADFLYIQWKFGSRWFAPNVNQAPWQMGPGPMPGPTAGAMVDTSVAAPPPPTAV